MLCARSDGTSHCRTLIAHVQCRRTYLQLHACHRARSNRGGCCKRARAHSRHRDKRCCRATASPQVNQARLSATATNDAPSTMVVVATTIATTRVQAKILDCSNVTRLTTRAKRRVRINKTPSTAHDTNCRNLPARCCSTAARSNHTSLPKESLRLTKQKLKCRNDTKRSQSHATSSIWSIQLVDHPFGR
jgi:hypothetical protein